MRRLLCIVFLLIIGQYAQSQDTCTLRVSLLTCSPGEELYSTFGHTAIRITDRSNATDIVYNYGTFEFDDPDFYLHFTQGKLRYYLARESFSDFVGEYRAEGRGVREQVLNLNCVERDHLQAALFDNMRTEKKYYKYDFLFDNCTTRARDMVFNNGPKGLTTTAIVEPNKVSFRNNLHKYLRAGNMAWSELGIDMLLGSRIDRHMTNQEAMFLPDYLEKGLDSTTFSKGRLVIERNVPILRPEDGIAASSFYLTDPKILMWALLAIFVGLTLFSVPGQVQMLRAADTFLFVLTGLLGSLFLFMWFGTEHQTCRDNYNLMWALPTNLIFAFLPSSRSVWVRRYFMLVAALASISVLVWFINVPQYLPYALLPLFILVAWRAWARSKG